MKSFYGIQSNDKGLSLTELIIAISIGAIVSLSVAALIAFSVRTYHNESVNTEMQYEIQTNVNQLMDAIMSSSGVVIVQGADRTEYAGFGKFEETTTPSAGFNFTGVIIASGKKDDTTGYFDIYMRRVTTPVFGTTAATAINGAVTPLKGPSGDKRPYLLGRNAKVFNISMDTDPATSSCIVKSWSSDTDPGMYINPLLVSVELEFEKVGTGKTINKRIIDNAVIRNKVTSDIWIEGKKYVLKK